MVERRRNIREISPIDVYRSLPGTNCGECGESNCMAFATRLVNGEVLIEECPPLRTEPYQELLDQIRTLLAPAVKSVTFGSSAHPVTIGGKHILQRHELTYHHPTPFAIDIADTLSSQAIEDRVHEVERFTYTYIGRELSLNAFAIRGASGDPDTFATAVRTVTALTPLPLILCTLDPRIMDAGAQEARDRHPLVYAATKDNWKAMAEIALALSSPLVVHAPGNIALLRSLTRTLTEYGVPDLVLDPGTFVDPGIGDTLQAFTLIRRAACRDQDTLLGYPLLGLPIAAWNSSELSPDVVRWKEACAGAILLSRYADLLIFHSLEGWVLLPQLIWRFNLYTDPRKPVSVEPDLRIFGSPNADSPVLLTTNYALTYFTVESDIKSSHLDCYLIVVDTGGISVESAVAGRYLTPEIIAAALKESGLEDKVQHRFLILPGLAARLSGEVEDVTGWNVLVGPKDSSGIPLFLKEHWPPPPE